MEITEVRMRIVEKKVRSEGRLRAVASITIDNAFVIHDIKIIDGHSGPFIAMPSRRSADGVFRDVAHPLNLETRTLLEKLILKKYEEEMRKLPESGAEEASERAETEVSTETADGAEESN